MHKAGYSSSGIKDNGEVCGVHDAKKLMEDIPYQEFTDELKQKENDREISSIFPKFAVTLPRIFEEGKKDGSKRG